MVRKVQVLMHWQTDRWTKTTVMHYWVGPDTLDLGRIISADMGIFICWVYAFHSLVYMQSIFNPIKFVCLKRKQQWKFKLKYTTFLLNVSWWSYYFLTIYFPKTNQGTQFSIINITVLQLMWTSNKNILNIHFTMV